MSPRTVSHNECAHSLSVLTALRQHASALAQAAIEDDVTEAFPHRAIRILESAGCLHAVLPPERGGLGLGWMPASTPLLLDLLRAMGGIHLSAARLFEGHVNAFELLWTCGTPDQRDAVCAYIRRGELLGVWNAPSFRGELTLTTNTKGSYTLEGPKAYASGAGGIRRPLVTAQHPELGLLIVWPDLPYEIGPADDWLMHGMRASMTRSVRFHGEVDHDHVFGTHDDYHRQPGFSGGAWRFLAAQLGAGEALVEGMRDSLVQRRRAIDTCQQLRMSECMVALDTARKWVSDAAVYLRRSELSIEAIVCHANEARIVVERALLDVLERVHRGVGLQSFSRSSPLERIARDLATYLRQPAPDALLIAVGEQAFKTPLPGLLGGPYDHE
ncbi:acyl-CoA dehydrogenase family protein [Dyella acidiphila]|uniref:Acyl-CoA dehydrogenase n=1 Tax=Dyella acidiphila TaxID=2775866 RepID=A0ABR9GC00_9GAMM|nr:acyl-CoA dehydrogenase family protein [Dyella acidiphila]MBE1161557.1 acyl-CoA dehydrogenase [Dyella acidiphila]